MRRLLLKALAWYLDRLHMQGAYLRYLVEGDRKYQPRLARNVKRVLAVEKLYRKILGP